MNLKFIGKVSECSFALSPFSEFTVWINSVETIGLDTETNVTDSILTRELKVISMVGRGSDDIWVLVWEDLSPMQKDWTLKAIATKLCIIQNVAFDYSIKA